jgi:hypothetical protein
LPGKAASSKSLRLRWRRGEGGRELLVEGLAVVSAAILLLAVLRNFRLTVLLSLLLVAVVLVLPLVVTQWSVRRRERQRLAEMHNLSTSDARVVMRMVDPGVDSGWGIQPQLRPAARDYAQHQLDRVPTPIWKLGVGAAAVVAVATIFSVANLRQGSGTLVLLSLVYVAQGGHHAYRSYKRPARMRAVLAKLTPDQAEI